MLKWILPGAMWLSMALLPILFFYFLRIRFRAQPVSSIYLWTRMQNTTSGGSKLRRRSIILLLLQIAAVIAAVAAVAQPFLFLKQTLTPGTVFLIDVSASMNTVETSSGSRRTRLEIARELLSEEIKKMDPKTSCMIFLCDNEANPLDKPNEGSRFFSNLSRIKSRNAGFNEAEVSNQLQAWLGRQNRPWQACLISDGGLDLGGQRITAVFGGDLKHFIVGNEHYNLGISGLRITGSKASFSVHNGWLDDQLIKVSLVFQNRTLARSTLKAPPGLSSQVISLRSETKPGIYKIQLEQNHDALPEDDVSYLAVNRPRRFRVLQVGSANPFLQSVLNHPAIELESISAFPKELASDWDLIIAEGVSIPPDLRANLLTFEQIPPKAPVSFAGNISGYFESSNMSHPLVRFVKWEDVQVADGFALKVDPQLPVLAEVAGKPVITVWEEEGWRTVVCGFSLYSSNIGLSGTFPIFFQNLLQWLTPQGANQLAYNLTVGEGVIFGEPSLWRIDNDKHFKLNRNGPSLQIEALKAGGFQWKTAREQGYLAVNIPFEESDLAPRTLYLKGKTVPTAAKLTTKQLELTQWPLLMLLGCLLLEWIIWRGGWRLRKELENVVD